MALWVCAVRCSVRPEVGPSGFTPKLFASHRRLDGGLYAVGCRVQILKDRATVRYLGPVKGQEGQWVGVEWDDASRGKHDGTTGASSCRSEYKVQHAPRMAVSESPHFPAVHYYYAAALQLSCHSADRRRYQVLSVPGWAPVGWFVRAT